MRPRAAVFCLHDIVPTDRLDAVPVTHRPYALSPEEFRAHLMAVAPHARRTIPVGMVPGELGGGFFCLTFDDGSASDYTEAFPVLHELGMRATFFIVPTLVGTPGYVTWPQLREMVAAGMEIGSHSMTHPFLHRLDADGVRREFGDSKDEPRAAARRARAHGVAAARLGAAGVRDGARPARLPRLLHQPVRLVVSRRPRARDAAGGDPSRHGVRRVRVHRRGRAARAVAHADDRSREERREGLPRRRWLAAAARTAARAAGARLMAQLLFWGSLLVILWVYVGYPVVLWLTARIRRRPVRRGAIRPMVSLIICAYNEERDIRRKLEDTLETEYPADRLEIIVASDGSTDRTDEIVREFAPRVTLLRVEAAAARPSRRTPRSRRRGRDPRLLRRHHRVHAAHHPRR